jgi:hypothetical protein
MINVCRQESLYTENFILINSSGWCVYPFEQGLCNHNLKKQTHAKKHSNVHWKYFLDVKADQIPELEQWKQLCSW